MFCSAKSAFLNLRNVLQSLNILSPRNKFKLPSRALLSFCRSEKETRPNNTKEPGGGRVKKKKKKVQPQFHGSENLQVPGQSREHDSLKRRMSGKGES